jgi:glutamate/tyrosine decarboxylase-like PLP-dependent enzyme
MTPPSDASPPSDPSGHPPPPEPTIEEYRQRYETYTALPGAGVARDDVLALMREMHAEEAARWGEGYASGAVYHGDPDHIAFLNEAYAINSQANPLHTDLWPSAVKFESEIVAMTGTMLGGAGIGDGPGRDGGICGTVSSGGSESIQLAMKAYRDHARAVKGITSPQMIVPRTAHAAFDKAAQYFGIDIVHVPTAEDWRADVAAMEAAITDDTIVMVGSAPPFPHGLIDPIEELSEVARAHDIGFHTDACLGGFVLPFAEKLGYPVPPFDFRLPGVTSMSADTHKFGYAAKGTSVVLYRTQELRHFQYFTMTDWPGGLYCSPSFAGSRPGALSAACWAALVSIGEQGYLDATRRILATADAIKAGLREMPELELFGDPLFVIAFASASDDLDVYRVNDAMTRMGWALNPLHRPAALHLCVTLRHTEAGVADRFLADLRRAVDEVAADPSTEGGMAPIYGMANTVPERGLVADAMLDVMDGWYRIPT